MQYNVIDYSIFNKIKTSYILKQLNFSKTSYNVEEREYILVTFTRKIP